MKNIYKKFVIILMVLVLISSVLIVPKVNVVHADGGATLIAGAFIVILLMVGSMMCINLIRNLGGNSTPQAKTQAKIYVNNLTEDFVNWLRDTNRTSSYTIMSSNDYALYNSMWSDYLTDNDMHSIKLDAQLVLDWLCFWKTVGVSESNSYLNDSYANYPSTTYDRIKFNCSYNDVEMTRTYPVKLLEDGDDTYRDLLDYNSPSDHYTYLELLDLGFDHIDGSKTMYFSDNIRARNKDVKYMYVYKNGSRFYTSYLNKYVYYDGYIPSGYDNLLYRTLFCYIVDVATGQIFINLVSYYSTDYGVTFNGLGNYNSIAQMIVPVDLDDLSLSDCTIQTATVDVSDIPVTNELDISTITDNSTVAEITDVIEGSTVDTATGTIDIPSADTASDAVIGGAITNIYNEYVNVSDTTTVTYEYPDYESPDIDDETMNKWKLPNAIMTRFPFCLPWDLMNLLSSFEQEPVMPSITLDYELYMMGTPLELNIEIPFEDLGIDVIATITRYASVISFILGLIFISRKMIMS